MEATQTLKAKKFDSIEVFDWKAGSFFITHTDKGDRPFMVLPCGDHFMPDEKWGMENIEDEKLITITPSILCGGSGKSCGWHGYLTKGEFRQV